MPRASRRTDRAGFGLLEVLVALVVLTVGVTALQRLAARTISVVGEDAGRTRALFAARTLVAEAALTPREPGHETGRTTDGLDWERVVARTPHPVLREVRVRVRPAGGGAAVELLEVVRVPPG
jgi:prepilin-type N-terminal cleavage/methylation domain-containing protein